MRIERADASHGPGLIALFERADCPCYCRYWDFPGDKRDWQNRCANNRETSKAELRTALATGDISGVVALLDEPPGTVIGWSRIAPVAHLGKSYEGQLYRGLPCFSGDRSRVFAMACFLVDPDHRRTGVARALLSHAIEMARAAGATAVEALPCGVEGIPDEQHWLGPPQMYEEAGFQVVHEFRPYPVLRLTL